MYKKLTKTKDPQYLEWIRSLPCALCEYQSKRYKDSSGRIRGGVAAHHVGGEGQSPRSNDYNTVPLCDKGFDPRCRDCHKEIVHQHLKKYRSWLKFYAVLLRIHYMIHKDEYENKT